MSENAKNQRRRDTVDIVDQQINRIDHIINKLLEDLDFDKITPDNRINFMIKLMSLCPRWLALKLSVKLDEPQARESTTLAAFQRYLRGEEPREE